MARVEQERGAAAASERPPLGVQGVAQCARARASRGDCYVTAFYLGIDPGLAGAIALVRADGSLGMVEDMPTSARGSGHVKHEADATGLAHLLRPHVSEI